jgi:hypothetical protein
MQEMEYLTRACCKMHELFFVLSRHLDEDISRAADQANSLMREKRCHYLLSMNDQSRTDYNNSFIGVVNALDADISWITNQHNRLLVGNFTDRERTVISSILLQRIYIICLNINHILDEIDAIIDNHSTIVKHKLLQVDTLDEVLFSTKKAMYSRHNNIDQVYVDFINEMRIQLQVRNVPEGGIMAKISQLRSFVENVFQVEFDSAHHLLHRTDNEYYNTIYKSKEIAKGLIDEIKGIIENINEHIAEHIEQIGTAGIIDSFNVSRDKQIRLFLNTGVVDELLSKIKAYLLP